MDIMLILYIILMFVLGLIIGSFLNVVINRLHEKKSITGRSQCPKCKHQLGSIDLIPLFSFLFSRQKCRYCKKPISWQYFLVEFFTGFIFVLLFVNYNFVETWHAMSLQNVLSIIFSLVLASFLIVIFVYDLKHMLILDKIVIPAIVIAFIGNLLLGKDWLDLLIGGLIGGGLFLFQFIISRGKWIGGGDIRLGLLMGFILGWQVVLVALFIAYLLGSIYGITLMIIKKKKPQDAIAFGTFLSVATILCMLYGNIILDAYLNLLYL